jgi:hypothetical protein
VRATAIWGKYQDGWLYLEDDSSGAEPVIMVAQGHAGDRAEVLRKMAAELVTYGQGQVEITAGIDPEPTDPVPGVDWIEGDSKTIDGEVREVEALTLTLDDSTGRWIPVPQFGTVLDIPEERIDRSFKNLGGLTGGTSHLTRPIVLMPRPDTRPS